MLPRVLRELDVWRVFISCSDHDYVTSRLPLTLLKSLTGKHEVIVIDYITKVIAPCLGFLQGCAVGYPLQTNSVMCIEFLGSNRQNLTPTAYLPLQETFRASLMIDPPWVLCNTDVGCKIVAVQRVWTCLFTSPAGGARGPAARSGPGPRGLTRRTGTDGEQEDELYWIEAERRSSQD